MGKLAFACLLIACAHTAPKPEVASPAVEAGAVPDSDDATASDSSATDSTAAPDVSQTTWYCADYGGGDDVCDTGEDQCNQDVSDVEASLQDGQTPPCARVDSVWCYTYVVTDGTSSVTDNDCSQYQDSCEDSRTENQDQQVSASCTQYSSAS